LKNETEFTEINRSEKRSKRKIGSESVERIVEQARLQSIYDKVKAFEAKR
jgi:hypothetical protein